MEENKKVKKISLVTAICLFIIVILIAALVGTVVYYNNAQEKIGNNNSTEKNEEKEVIETINENIDEIAKDLYKKADNIIMSAKAGELREQYNVKKPEIEKEINGKLYIETAEKFENVENKYKKIFTGKALEKALEESGLINVNGVLYIDANDGGGTGWTIEPKNAEKINEINDEIEYIIEYTTIEQNYTEEGKGCLKIKKVNGEYRVSEIDLLGMSVSETPENQKLEEQDKIEEDIINVEEVYVYSNGSNNKEADETSSEFSKIGFSSDGKFIINLGGYFDTVTGKYELIGENIRRCKLEKYSFDEPDGRKTHYVADANWFVDLKIVDDNKIKVVSNDLMDKDGEFAVSFGIALTIDKEFTKYDIKDFIGTWKSSHAYKLNDTEYNSYYEEVDLYDVLGRSAAQYGSTFTLNEDGSFKDYIHPVTEADMYRDGEYTFNNGNEFDLKYVDGDKEAKIYIINENTIVHESRYYRIVLVK